MKGSKENRTEDERWPENERAKKRKKEEKKRIKGGFEV